MESKYLWVKNGSRLKCICVNAGVDLHWIFLPGGPGIDSEYFSSLTQYLSVPGTIWHLDLPNNGSNLLPTKCSSLRQWGQALIEITQLFDKVILVGHSFGGIFALSIPELEQHLRGLVIMNSTPGQWRQAADILGALNGLPPLDEFYIKYFSNPSNTGFKSLMKDLAPYFFAKPWIKAGLAMLDSLSYNHKLYDCKAAFMQTYQVRWIPSSINTMIIGGEKDSITPFSLFCEDKRFNNSRILLRRINNAGHFPWLENFAEVDRAFMDYLIYIL